MRVLQIHNTYKHFGGEDVVIELEKALLKEHGVEVKALKFDNSAFKISEMIYSKSSYEYTNKAILEFKPDVIHVHNLFYKATPSVLYCAKKHKIPVIMTLHNYRLICPNALLLRNQKPCLKCVNSKIPIYSVKHSCFQDSMLKSLMLTINLGYYNTTKKWDSLVDRFIVLSSFAKQTFSNSSLEVSNDKFIVKYNSVDDLQVNNNINSAVRQDYLYIGRLSEEKGPQIAIEAFNSLPNLKLHVIGDGPLLETLRKKAQNNIIFHGKRDKQFVTETLRGVKALIFPSICFEGLPNTILEAFSSSTPIIFSDIDNINTLVEDNVTGIKFKTNDSLDLANKVKTFENIKNNDLSKNARATYLANFTHQKNALSLLKIYTEVSKQYEESKYS